MSGINLLIKLLAESGEHIFQDIKLLLKALKHAATFPYNCKHSVLLWIIIIQCYLKLHRSRR